MFGNEPPKSRDALDRKPLARMAQGFFRFLRTTACYRHCERSEAIHPSFARRNGLLRFARNDVESFEFQSAKRQHSRGTMPELCDSLSPMRGRRECRVPASTRGLVCKMHSRMRTRAYRYSRSSPAFPAQWSYGLCRALPGDEFVLPPSPAN